MIGQAETLGVDTGWIAVGGQSAGGAHAAALAQLVRDDGGPRFAFQLLDIPVTDDTVSTDSASQYADTAVWTTECARLSWDAYLGSRDPGAHPAASAARARDLSGLPPAFITVGQFDPLRDEGIEYARRLAHAGVPTELHMYPGTFHGSSGIAVTAAVSIRQNNDLVAAFCRAAATHTKGESA